MHKLYFEYQAYSEAADFLYSRAGDCPCDHMSNSYIKIADRLEGKATSLCKKIHLDKPTSKKILTHTAL
tara:strand:+ start:264 stop:470 length:207 start_codon:yes stop_codon:yes gene_type:complete